MLVLSLFTVNEDKLGKKYHEWGSYSTLESFSGNKTDSRILEKMHWIKKIAKNTGKKENDFSETWFPGEALYL